MLSTFPPVTTDDVENVIELIKELHPILIFFDGSYFGKMLCEIRKRINLIYVITFFHNVEYDYINVRMRKTLKANVYRKLVSSSEQQMVNQSDMLICLTEADSCRIHSLYGKKANSLVPITLPDNCLPLDDKRVIDDSNYILMFGAYRRDTVLGVQWFLDCIYPYICRKVVVAGNGFEKFKVRRDNIVIRGKVEDLVYLYSEAACVVLPIIIGAGMKVKTCEALMYGRNIAGTDEAFVGYDRVDLNKIGIRYTTSGQLIEYINGLNGKELFNKLSRQSYLEYYSESAAKRYFKNIFDSIDSSIGCVE